MYGSLNENALESVSSLLREQFDFARCQRPDGSVYGSRGKCKQGVPVAAEPEKAPKKRGKKKAPPVFTPEQRRQFDSLYQDKDDAASDRKFFGKEIRELDKKEQRIRTTLEKTKTKLAKQNKRSSSETVAKLEQQRQEAAERAKEAKAAREASEARLAALRARLAESEAKYGKLTGRRRK